MINQGKTVPVLTVTNRFDLMLWIFCHVLALQYPFYTKRSETVFKLVPDLYFFPSPDLTCMSQLGYPYGCIPTEPLTFTHLSAM